MINFHRSLVQAMIRIHKIININQLITKNQLQTFHFSQITEGITTIKKEKKKRKNILTHVNFLQKEIFLETWHRE